MEYINAKDVLPETLIYEIQQYIGGSLIYIPQNDKNKTDVSKSRSRNDIIVRNNIIKEKKKNGATIDELMREYYLSYDTIKSIVYRKK